MSLHVTAAATEDLLNRDWLSVNHLGGYASSSPLGINTRKYHGLLVAAMSPPVRRMVLLSRVEETLYINGRAHSLSASEYPDTIHPRGFEQLVAFDHEPFPRWAYQSDGWTIAKELHLLPDSNTVCLTYTLLGGVQTAELELRPMFALRGMHELMFQWSGRLESTELSPGHHRLAATNRTPEVFFAHDGEFRTQPLWYLNTIYRHERERGYSGLEDVWTPGAVRWSLAPGRSVHFICSTDPIDLRTVLAESQRIESTITTCGADAETASLLRAAGQFVPTASTDGTKARTELVTQYPWGAPSGRHALIAFCGLFLVPCRFAEAKALLESMARDLWNGLMPSEYPEDGSPPRYNGADVSLWFVQAVHQYLQYTKAEPASAGDLIDAVEQIVQTYQHGTALGIGMDVDGLLSSHAAGIATTWMDAKAGDWIVTPRQGRPVELNALWYNALCIASELTRGNGNMARAEELAMLAMSVRHAFNHRFWNEHTGCCFDVISDYGVDPAIRPNQLLAISLPNAVLAPEYHARVLDVVREKLLTPVGLRSLAPGDPGYCGRYEGDPVARDRAYHQGSVYPWLLGPYVDAFLHAHGNSPKTRQEIREVLTGCIEHLRSDGLGQLGDLFDGDVPRRASGSIACARSVGEVLRAWVVGVLNVPPGSDCAAAGRLPIGAAK